MGASYLRIILVYTQSITHPESFVKKKIRIILIYFLKDKL